MSPAGHSSTRRFTSSTSLPRCSRTGFRSPRSSSSMKGWRRSPRNSARGTTRRSIRRRPDARLGTALPRFRGGLHQRRPVRLYAGTCSRRGSDRTHHAARRERLAGSRRRVALLAVARRPRWGGDLQSDRPVGTHRRPNVEAQAGEPFASLFAKAGLAPTRTAYRARTRPGADATTGSPHGTSASSMTLPIKPSVVRRRSSPVPSRSNHRR